jgi:fatty acid desaturase
VELEQFDPVEKVPKRSELMMKVLKFVVRLVTELPFWIWISFQIALLLFGTIVCSPWWMAKWLYYWSHDNLPEFNRQLENAIYSENN